MTAVLVIVLVLALLALAVMDGGTDPLLLAEIRRLRAENRALRRRIGGRR